MSSPISWSRSVYLKKAFALFCTSMDTVHLPYIFHAVTIPERNTIAVIYIKRAKSDIIIDDHM